MICNHDAMSYDKSAHLYDLFDRKANIEFFAHFAVSAGEALDVGAGTGRIAIPLAEQGVSLYCVEPSPAMRREFERKLTGLPEIADRIRIVPGAAADFVIGQRFKFAFLSGCFDHFITDQERRDALENIGSHLKPGGILVFDVFLGLMGDKPLSSAGEAQMEDMLIKRFVGSEVVSTDVQQVEMIYEIYEGDNLLERIEEIGQVGVVHRQDVRYILEQTGFTARHEWGDYDFTPYHEGDPLLIVEAVMSADSDDDKLSWLNFNWLL